MPQYILSQGTEEHRAEVARLSEGRYGVTIAGRTVEADARMLETGVCSLIVDGICFEVHFSREGHDYTLLINGEHYEVAARNRRVRSAVGRGTKMLAGRQVIQAPMPGRVVRVLVEVGATVAAGDTLLVLEAMKMENQLRSPIDGVVVEVTAAEGQVVQPGHKLAVVE
ncbi:MAG: biotin/lipoyl-containing protein [Thermoleophilia bacterium]